MSQPVPQPSWKEEVNRRLEAHKNRRGISVVENPGDEQPGSVSDRAAQAAARVAARFSKAPSYSEMQAAEARAALRVAEAATRAALEAQAAAQLALANLQSAEEEEIAQEEEFHAAPFMPEPEASWKSSPRWEPEPDPQPAKQEPVAAQPGASWPSTSWKVRWEPDFPARSAETEPVRTESQQKLESAAADHSGDHGITTVDAQPIQANLIHFPREIVATRRMRPRIGVPAEQATQQLSIFEVDPGTISTEPMLAVADSSAGEPSWAGPEWSGIKLDAHPQHEPRVHREVAVVPVAAVHLAPVESRLLAAAVDLALILVMACAAVWGITGHLVHNPTLKFAEMCAAAGFILIGLAYQAFFLLTAKSTPGMMYAGLALCTFDDEYPTAKQLRDRLIALLISLLPVGLGMAWAIFDEDHLSWHDRLSRTYQRKC